MLVVLKDTVVEGVGEEGEGGVSRGVSALLSCDHVGTFATPAA